MALGRMVAYLDANPDARASGVNPLDHYDQIGWRAGRDPGPNFDTTIYLLRNPDVAAAGVDPLAHYLEFGIYEGRQAHFGGAGEFGFVDYPDQQSRLRGGIGLDDDRHVFFLEHALDERLHAADSDFAAAVNHLPFFGERQQDAGFFQLH